MVLGLFKKTKHGPESGANDYEVVQITDLSRLSLAELRRASAGEQGREWKDSDPFSPLHFDEFEQDSLHFVCRRKKTKEPAAYGRLTPASVLQRFPDWLSEYHLEAFPEKESNRIAVLSRLLVLGEHRKRLPAVMLAVRLYETALEHMNAWATIALSDFSDYNFNRFLGYRPMASISLSKFGGYRLPLFLIHHDYKRLKVSESPLHSAAQAKGFPRCDDGLRWMEAFHSKGGRIETGFTAFDPQLTKRYEPPVMKGLSAKGREEFMAKTAYLKRGRGDVVLQEGLGGAELGFVMQGALEVKKEDRVLAVLSEGDVFGEIAAVLGTPRTANVTAAVPNTEILLVPMQAVENMKSEPDRCAFWRNLAEIILCRLLASCRLTEGLDEQAILKEIAAECGCAAPEAETAAGFLSALTRARADSGPEEETAFWKRLCEILARHLTEASRSSGGAASSPPSEQQGSLGI